MEKKQILLTFLKAVYAGIAISIGGIIYLSVENKIIASLLFSFGLSTVVVQGYNLYSPPPARPGPSAPGCFRYFPQCSFTGPPFRHTVPPRR